MAMILVVDDDADLRKALGDMLGARGHEVRGAASGEEALAAVERDPFQAVLLDLNLGGMDGLAVLERLRTTDPELPVVVLTGDTGVPTAVRAMKLGASDYVTKPCRNEEIHVVVEKALRQGALQHEVEVLRGRLDRSPRPPADDVVGPSAAMAAVLEQVSRIAPTDLTVVLQGESGTGKELLARRIHQLSARREGDFVAVDCGALPDTLVESELFGHEKGAFTGAHQRKLGQFELASGGTLFLDEIVNLPYATQSKLLRALQERRIRRVGGRKDLEADARIIVAANVDLGEAVRSGRLREDLYHRLNQFALVLPPLRERAEDIEPLARHFLKDAAGTLGRHVETLTPAAVQALKRHRWPGNVRELKNAVTRAALLADRAIEPEHLALPGALAGAPATGGTFRPASFKKASRVAAADAEKRLLADALRSSGGNKAKAARLLGITRMTLYLKLRRYGIKL